MRPGPGVDHPPPSVAEVKERVELYLYSPSGTSWPVIEGTLLYFILLYFEHLNFCISSENVSSTDIMFLRGKTESDITSNETKNTDKIYVVCRVSQGLRNVVKP